MAEASESDAYTALDAVVGRMTRLITEPLFSSEFYWTYDMKRTMQEVIPGLFLGPYSVASRSNLELLRAHGITHIICIRQEKEAHFIRPNFPEIFCYMVLNIEDRNTENIICHFPTVKKFIDSALNFGGKVLIHGNAGISRTSAITIAYIMETLNISAGEAFAAVAKKRFCISPNQGFMVQLADYEMIYKARLETSPGFFQNKRSLDPDPGD